MPTTPPSPNPARRLALGLGRSLLPLLALFVLASVPLVGPHWALLLAFLLWRAAARHA